MRYLLRVCIHLRTYVHGYVFKWCNSVKHNVMCGCTRIRTSVCSCFYRCITRAQRFNFLEVPVMKPVFALRGASFLAHFCAYAGRSRELDGSLIELGGHKQKYVRTYMQRRHYVRTRMCTYTCTYCRVSALPQHGVCSSD